MDPTTSIIVSGFPHHKPLHDLESHFLSKRKSGGGDIADKGIRKLEGSECEWIVNFDDIETKVRVLQKPNQRLKSTEEQCFQLQISECPIEVHNKVFKLTEEEGTPIYPPGYPVQSIPHQVSQESYIPHFGALHGDPQSRGYGQSTESYLHAGVKGHLSQCGTQQARDYKQGYPSHHGFTHMRQQSAEGNQPMGVAGFNLEEGDINQSGMQQSSVQSSGTRETKQLSSPDLTNSVVYIQGFKSTIDTGILEMFFEDTKRSQGGPVEDIEIKDKVAKITFQDPYVALRVRERKAFELGNDKLEVCGAPETTLREPDIKTEIKDGTVCLKGFPKDEAMDSLELFLESSKKSGGGSIVNIERNRKGIVIVKFENKDVAAKLLKRRDLQYGDYHLEVILPPNPTEQLERTIFVKGLSKDSNLETLEMFLESPKKSGGGPIVEIDKKSNQIAVVEFEDKDVAEKLLAKHFLKLGNDQLRVFKPPKLTETEERTVLVEGFPKDTPLDILEMFFESRRSSGGGPIENFEVTKKGIAVIQYADKNDAQRVRNNENLVISNQHLTIIDIVKDDPCEVLVKGIMKGTSYDDVEMFFENKRKSGGGDIRKLDYNKEKGVARIIFMDEKVAKQVKEKKQLKLKGGLLTITEEEDEGEDEDTGKEDTDDNKDDTSFKPDERIVDISGIPSDVSLERLEMFFESERRSGGGELEGIQYDDKIGEAQITFKDKNVAQRVLQKKDLKLGNTKVSATTQRPPSKAVLVRGINQNSRRNAVEMFFESNKRTGGGEIAVLKFEPNKGMAYIEYAEYEVAQEVARRAPFLFEGSKLDVKLHKEGSSLTAPDDNEDEALSQPHLPHAIEVVSSGLKEDILQLFFENRSHSGGGEIEEIFHDERKDRFVITFKSPEAVTRIMQKPSLVVTGTRLQVSALSGIEHQLQDLNCQTEEKKIIVTNLTDSIKPDLLSLKLEKYSKSEVKQNPYYGVEPGVALVEFSTKPDFRRLKNHFSVKPIRGVFLHLKRIPLCSTIQVHSKKDFSSDMLGMWFENKGRSGGEKITEIEKIENTNVAIITFEDHKVVESVLKKKHTLEGTEMHVAAYYKDLGIIPVDHDTSKPSVGIPSGSIYLIKIPYALTFLKGATSEIENIDKKLKNRAAKVDWSSSSDGKLQIACTLTHSMPATEFEAGAKSWETDVHQCLDELLGDIKNEEIRTLKDTWDTVLGEFRNQAAPMPEECVLDMDVTAATVRLTGRSVFVDKYATILKDISSKVTGELSHTKEKTEEIIPFTVLKKHQQNLFHKTGLYDQLQMEFKGIDIEVDLDRGLVMKGLGRDLMKAKIKILQRGNEVVTSKLKQDPRVIRMLSKHTCRDFLDERLKKSNAVVSWELHENDEILIAALKDTELSKAVEVIQREFVCTEEIIPSESKALFNTKEWKDFKQEFDQKYEGSLVISLDLDQSMIGFAGTENHVAEVKEEYENFLKDNTVLEVFIPLTKTFGTTMQREMGEELESISRDLKSHKVEVVMLYSDDTWRVRIRGTVYGVGPAKNKVLALKRRIMEEVNSWEEEEEQKILDQQTAPSLLDDEAKVTKVLASFCEDGRHNIKVVSGNLTDYSVDVIVNAANSELKHNGGLAKAIVQKGGEEIQEECFQYIQSRGGKILVGDTVFTKPGKLPCRMILHVVGPMWRGGRKNEENDLYDSITNCLYGAAEQGMKSIAFPALCTGIFRYPLDQSVKIMIDAVNDFFESAESDCLEEVHLVDNSKKVTDAFVEALEEKFGRRSIQKAEENIEAKFDIERGQQELGYLVQEMTKHIATGIDEYTERLRHEERIQRLHREENIQRQDLYQAVLTDVGDDDTQAMTREGLHIKINKGEIAKEKVDAIVNSISNPLNLDQGAISKSILQRGGDEIQQEVRDNAPRNFTPGDIIKSTGGNLDCKHVFHGYCCNWTDRKEKPEQVLRKIVKSSLKEAETLNLESIAFPAIGTGNLKFPKDLVAKSMFEEVVKFSKENPNSVKEIFFSIYQGDKESLEAFQAEMTRLKQLRQSTEGCQIQ